MVKKTLNEPKKIAVGGNVDKPRHGREKAYERNETKMPSYTLVASRVDMIRRDERNANARQIKEEECNVLENIGRTPPKGGADVSTSS